MRAFRNLQIDFREDRVVVLTLDMEGKSVNVLSREVVDELEQALRDIANLKDAQGLLIRSAKPGIFIAGASVEEIFELTNAHEASEAAKTGQDVMNDIARLAIPSVAAINGICVGGGLELALACTYRVCADDESVRLALPEVNLGIIPGFGGTQRMPQVVGLIPAMDAILKGRNIFSKKALKLGLVDDVVPLPILEETASEILFRKPKLQRPSKESFRNRWLARIPQLRKLAFRRARKDVSQITRGFYPAPFAALDVLEDTFFAKSIDGFEVESRRVGELITSPVSKNLIRIFQATEEIRKRKFVEDPMAVTKVGVVGAGIMGSGIAQHAASKGRAVRLRDINLDALAKGLEKIHDANLKDLRRKRIDSREHANRWAKISPTTDWTGFAKADLIVEAALEDMAVKQNVFRELSARVRSDTILATNTSALSVSEIARAAAHPERVVGMHFFNPVHSMPLVEIIRGEQTSEKTLATTFAFALKIGKTPIIVTDRPGFLVNRILGIYLNEACRAASDGIPVSEIETTMKDFGMPMGPFELIDEVGLDIARKVGEYLASALPGFPAASPLLGAIASDGRLGKKNGLGFYIHTKKGIKTLDQNHIDRALHGLTENRKFSMTTDQYKNLVDRFVLAMVNEASKCLAEGVVETERDVDIGMVYGTGFPPFRGGLMTYARARGFEEIHQTLSELGSKFGEYFAPSPYLRDHARAHPPSQPSLLP